VLPLEQVKGWYGISADTAARGIDVLVRHELMQWRRVRKKAPLAPLGYTYERRYTLGEPFGPRGRLLRRRRIV
jgi:hypothetical protein